MTPPGTGRRRRKRVPLGPRFAPRRFLVAVELFLYGSSNHAEGAYLQQAHLLLDGRLGFTTELADRFRWWSFLEDGSRLYPGYAPVPAAASFALGLAAGVPRLSLVATFVREGSATVSYRQELPARTDGGRVELVWPPATRVRRRSSDCGYEGTYLGDRGEYLDGVVVGTEVNSTG